MPVSTAAPTAPTTTASTDWRSTFKFFDTDSSGAISAAELLSALHALGQDEATLPTVHAIFADLGLPPDGELTFDQYAKLAHTLFSSSTSITRSDLSAMYAAIDIDLSGYVTAAELRHFMTGLRVDMDDEEMAEMVAMYDLDGDNQISVGEFEEVLKGMGYVIVEDGPPSDKNDASAAKGASPSVQNGEGKGAEGNGTDDGPALDLSKLALDDDRALETLRKFDAGSTGKIPLALLDKAAALLAQQLERERSVSQSQFEPGLHWTPGRSARGLGDLVHKANHIGLIVADVGRSARFYSDVVGLQQIRRPNFDKHGAWFTMGNLELHLIKGTPIVHSGDDLIVNHISLETFGIDQVPHRLKKMGVPFRQNVSVPKREDGGQEGKTNDDKDSVKIVRQYFFRDPDGYYLEVCNCMLLTDYCLGKRSSLAGYDESVRPLSLKDAAVTVGVMQKWATNGRRALKDRAGALRRATDETDGSIEAVAQTLGCTPADQADDDVLAAFRVRQTVYGDICQTFSEVELERVACATGNDARAAFEVMHLVAQLGGRREFVPPAFFEEGRTLVKPDSVAAARAT